MHVTPFYAAILALMFFALSVRTLRLRHRLRIGIGDAGDEQMLRAMRVHANFAEYVPIALLLILMIELQGMSRLVAHALCALLIVGRVTHAFGVSRTPEDFKFRVFGMSLTFTSLLGAAAYLLYGHLWQMFTAQ